MSDGLVLFLAIAAFMLAGYSSWLSVINLRRNRRAAADRERALDEIRVLHERAVMLADFKRYLDGPHDWWHQEISRVAHDIGDHPYLSRSIK